MYNLEENEARVIGVLLEKEATTPDQYPLSLNALTTGCNQKTNRDPVLNLSESDVQDVLAQLDRQGLVMQVRLGGRVPKYKHRFCNTEFSELKLSKQEQGITCVMLLRGAQTPGELRTRTNRLCDFNDVGEVEKTLESLSSKGYVTCLPKEPGKRESRYQHLFGSEELTQRMQESSGEIATVSASGSQDKTKELEERVAALEEELSYIKSKISDLL